MSVGCCGDEWERVLGALLAVTGTPCIVGGREREEVMGSDRG